MAENDPKGWMIFQHAGPIELARLRVKDVNIHDIAHGLNWINRFIGQTRYPLSVLWHSLMVTELCRNEAREVQLEALFHDAGETYVGDWIRPLATVMQPKLTDLRKRIQTTCYHAAGLTKAPGDDAPAMAEADNLMQRFELQSSWGFDRRVAWQTPISAAERARAEAAIERVGHAQYPYQQQLMVRRFLQEADRLLGARAALRRSIEKGRKR